MSVSPFAERLLQSHAVTPSRIFCNVELLGSLFRESDLNRLNHAYEELAAAGLMEKAALEGSFFGTPVHFYKLTAKAAAEASQESAA